LVSEVPGEWSSPITPEQAAAASGSLTWVGGRAGETWWCASDPATASVRLMRRSATGQVVDVLGADRSARNQLCGYGGRPYALCDDGSVVFTEGSDQRLYHDSRPLTPPDATTWYADPTVRGFIANAGQVCLAGTRLLVQASIYDTVVEALAKAVGAIKVGPQPDAMVGPISTQAQYQRIKSYFEIARQEGAVAVVGGEVKKDAAWGNGWFIPPTVYVNVRNDMRIAREEIFGPVLVVIAFEDEAQAVSIANDSEYGLAAGIWTQSLSRAHRVAAAIQAGQIYVNEYLAGGVETPLGGYKNSGYGREKGLEALHHYTQLKCVTIKL